MRFVLPILLYACGPVLDETSSALDDRMTLDEERKLVAEREAYRAQTYEPGLRARLPPSEWIAHAMHGEVVDANFEPIVWDEQTLGAIQGSLFERLYAAAGDAAREAYGKDVAELYAAQGLARADRLTVRAAALHGLARVAPEKLRDQLAWRVGIARRGVAEQIASAGDKVTSAAEERIGSYRFPDWGPPEPPPGQGYIDRCAAAGVPIPPSWPDDAWQSQGELAINFLTPDMYTEVFTYRDPAIHGLCYALPRWAADRTVMFLGIICQNNDNGNVCFWDNRDRRDGFLRERDLRLEIGRIGDGDTLGEVCTECHRGSNAFNVHPYTALDVPDHASAVWPTAIGAPRFAFPPPLALPAPPSDQARCDGCHAIPQLHAQYCDSVLQPAALMTMPPRPLRPPPGVVYASAGWPGTPYARAAAYRAHIDALYARCP